MKTVNHIYSSISELTQLCDRIGLATRMSVVQIVTNSQKQAEAEAIASVIKVISEKSEVLHVVAPVAQTALAITLYVNEAKRVPSYSADSDAAGYLNRMEHGELYRSAINATSEGFWLLDEALKIIDVNYSLCAMLGYLKSEMVGKKPHDFVDHFYKRACEQQVENMEKQTQRIFEIVFLTKAGKKLHMLVNATTMHAPGSAPRTFAFMTDISKHKKIEADLLRRQQELNLLNANLETEIARQVKENRSKDQMMFQQARLASMGEMIGNIAHQWRQPLNILALVMQDLYISGQLGTLTREKLESEYERANSVLQYMSQTIDDFRNFFQNREEPEPFSFKESIHAVYSLLSSTFEKSSIRFDMEISDDIKVLGHQNAFTQVIINIFNNAREAIQDTKTENGRVTAVAEVAGKAVRLIISDNGGGIAESNLDKIFEPYFTTKYKSQGTGLGLYMSKQIVENSMYGRLRAENYEEGARFIIELPVEEGV